MILLLFICDVLGSECECDGECRVNSGSGGDLRLELLSLKSEEKDFVPDAKDARPLYTVFRSFISD